MGKVIRLFNEQEKRQEDLIRHIEDLLEFAKRGEIKSFMVCAEQHEGYVVTGYCNLDVGEKQYLVGHIQSDITFEVMEANIDKLIERV